MTPERLNAIEEMAKGDRWICDNGLCDYIDELIVALRESLEREANLRLALEAKIRLLHVEEVK